MDWASWSVLVGVLGPLVGVPLTAITLYLRAIREHQTAGAAEVMHRIGNVEQSIRELTRSITEIERDYTTKEEWLRESMHARQQLERLTEVMVRVQTELEDPPWAGGLAVEIGRMTRAVVEMTRERHDGG